MSTSGAKVLALDMGGTKLIAGIGHADGEITRMIVVPTPSDDGASAVLDRALEMARDCWVAERDAGGECGAVGVSTMGLTRDSHVELAPNVRGWEALRIREAVEAAFPEHPVIIGNDVKVATRAEMTWGALRDVQDGLYLNLGTGIAAGIVVDGRLLEGAHEAAGEVGYTLAGDGFEQRDMAREGVAPFEGFFGGGGVARRLTGTELPGTVAEIVAREQTDPGAQAFLRELWTGIAVLSANLCSALDPSVLVIGGGYVRSPSGLLARVQEILERAVPFPPKLLTARFGADASLRGAVAIALTGVGAA